MWGLRAMLDELRAENADLKKRLQTALEVQQNNFDELVDLRANSKWVIGILKTLLELKREPTRDDLERILEILEPKEKPPADAS